MNERHCIKLILLSILIVLCSFSVFGLALTSVSLNISNLGYGHPVSITTNGASGTNYRLECGSVENGTKVCVSGNITSGEINCNFFNAVNQTNSGTNDPYQDAGNHLIYCRLNDSSEGYSSTVTVNITTNTSYCDKISYSPLYTVSARNWSLCPGFYKSNYSDSGGVGNFLIRNLGLGNGFNCNGATLNMTVYGGGDGNAVSIDGGSTSSFLSNCNIIQSVNGNGRNSLNIRYLNMVGGGTIFSIYNNNVSVGTSNTVVDVTFNSNVIGTMDFYNNIVSNRGTYAIYNIMNWQAGAVLIHNNNNLTKPIYWYPNSANKYNMSIYDQEFSILKLNTVDNDNYLNVTNCTISYNGDSIDETSWTFNLSKHIFYRNNFINGTGVIVNTPVTMNYNYWGGFNCTDNNKDGLCENIKNGTTDGTNITDLTPYYCYNAWLSSCSYPNSAPVITVINFTSNISVSYATNNLSFQINATDTDGNNLNCTLIFNGSAQTYLYQNQSTLFNWTGKSIAPHELTPFYFSCFDGTTTTNSTTYYINYNNTPCSNSPNPTSFSFNYTTTSKNFTNIVTDPDGDLSSVWFLFNSTLAQSWVNQASGNLVYNISNLTLSNITFAWICKDNYSVSNTTDSYTGTFGNLPPYFVQNLSSSYSMLNNETFSLDVNCSDPEGSAIIYSVSTTDADLIINSATGLITDTTPTSVNVVVYCSDGSLNVSQSFNMIVHSATGTSGGGGDSSLGIIIAVMIAVLFGMVIILNRWQPDLSYFLFLFLIVLLIWLSYFVILLLQYQYSNNYYDYESLMNHLKLFYKLILWSSVFILTMSIVVYFFKDKLMPFLLKKRGENDE